MKAIMATINQVLYMLPSIWIAVNMKVDVVPKSPKSFNSSNGQKGGLRSTPLRAEKGAQERFKISTLNYLSDLCYAHFALEDDYKPKAATVIKVSSGTFTQAFHLYGTSAAPEEP